MIKKRKDEHLDICGNKESNIEMDITTGFEDILFVNTPLPEINFDEITLETEFLGKKLNYPIFITGITGGSNKAKRINKIIASVAEQFGIAFGVGSQRPALEDESLINTYKIVRQEAPTTFIAGNLGAIQLNYGISIEEIQKTIDMIEADALALHMNALQEIIQPEGNKNFKNLLDKIKEVQEKITVPIILKEVGCGIPDYDIQQFIDIGIKVVDISGAGGTSWAKIEGVRAKDQGLMNNVKTSEVFANWGIPTAMSTIEAAIFREKIKIISSGGIRNGLEAAKALAIGAHLVGIALPVIQILNGGTEKQLIDYLNQFIQELKTTMFLVGAKNLEELYGAPFVVLGKTAEWLSARNIELIFD